jgi:hypothetical protein
MRANKIFLLALITITCTSMMCECDDKTTYEPQLPPETTTGANTFGCLVNGKVWLNGGVGIPNYSLAINELSDTTLGIVARRKTSNTTESIILYVSNSSLKENRYIIGTTNIYINYLYTDIINQITCNYQGVCKGFIKLNRFDLLNDVVSGSFEATLYNSECDSAVITQGRFDLKK